MRRRFIDSHVHLWDVHLHPDWYRSFPKAGDTVLGFEMIRPWQEQFLWEAYSRSVNVADLVKWVHVSAVDDPGDVEAETGWIIESARKCGAPPYAIVGSIDAGLPPVELEASLDRQMVHPSYRGIRFLGQVEYDGALFSGLLAMLAARDLVYDTAAQPRSIEAVTKAVSRHPELTVVLEHTGMPEGAGEDAFATWRQGVAKFAELPNSYCKLSGLLMTLHYPKIDLFRKFFDE